MGYQSNSNSNSLRFGSTDRQLAQDTSWKSQGFLNLWLPKTDGELHKLGFIGLKESDPVQAELLKMVRADVTTVDLILANLIIEYRSAMIGDGKGLAMFGGKVPAPAATDDRTTNGTEKARGYLNLYLPDSSEAGKTKIGFIALRNSVVFERQIVEACEDDAVEAIDVLKEHLSMDYRSGTSSKGKPTLKLVAPVEAPADQVDPADPEPAPT